MFGFSKTQRVKPSSIKHEDLFIEGIGNIKLTRRRNSNRISMRVAADGMLSVNCPWNMPQRDVIDFVNKNSQWAEVNRKKMESRKRAYTAGSSIKTRYHNIEIISSDIDKCRANLSKNNVVIILPQARPIDNIDNQTFINNVLSEIYRREAKSYLPDRVAELAEKHGFVYKKVFIKKLKSKWGSCSSEGNINLNLHLMSLPDNLIDYIILHELTHTIEMNHGAGFWNILNKLTNNQARALDKEVKHHSI